MDATEQEEVVDCEVSEDGYHSLLTYVTDEPCILCGIKDGETAVSK